MKKAQSATKSAAEGISASTDQLQGAVNKAQTSSKQAAKGIEQGANSAESAVKRFDKVGSALKKVGAVVAAAVSVKAIVDFGKQCIELGSDLSEVQNVVDVTFGDMAEKVDGFAKSAITQFGLSETAAKQYTSTMGSMLKSMGLSTSDAYDMSTALTGLAGDMASFYNISADEAFSKLRSGISGETEPLKQLGINMSVANLEAYALSQGITEDYNAMTQAEQATLRYNYILQATADAQGDFSRTSDSWANQTRILAMRFDSIKASLGQGLIAALTPVVKVINQILERLQVFADKFRDVMAQITGTDIQSNTATADAGTAQIEDSEATLEESSASYADNTQDAAQSMEKTQTAAKKTGKALTDGAKSAASAVKGVLMGFDEINTLGGGNVGAASTGTSGSSITDNVDPQVLDALQSPQLSSGMDSLTDATQAANSEIEKTGTQITQTTGFLDVLKTKLQPLIDLIKKAGNAFKEGFSKGLGKDFTSRLSGIVDSVKRIGAAVKDIFTDSGVSGAISGWIESLSGVFGRLGGAAVSGVTTIAENITGGISRFLEDDGDRIKGWFTRTFGETSESHKLVGDFAVSVADIFSVFGDENGQELTGNIIGIFADGFMGVSEAAQKLFNDILAIFTQPITMNTEGIKEALDGLLGSANSIAETVHQAVIDIGDTLNNIYDEHFAPLFESISQGVTEFIGVLVDDWNTYFQPVIDKLTEEFRRLWDNHLKPLFDSVMGVFGALGDLVGAFWEKILQPAIMWIGKNVVPVLTPILDILGYIMDAIGRLADLISGIANMFSGTITMIAAKLTGNLEKMQEGVDKMYLGKDQVKQAFTRETTLEQEVVQEQLNTQYQNNTGSQIEQVQGWDEASTAAVNALNNASSTMDQAAMAEAIETGMTNALANSQYDSGGNVYMDGDKVGHVINTYTRNYEQRNYPYSEGYVGAYA